MSKRNLYAELMASLKEMQADNIDEWKDKTEDELMDIACAVVADARRDSQLESIERGLEQAKRGCLIDKGEFRTVMLDDPGIEWVPWDDLDTTLIEATEVLERVASDKRMKLPKEFGDVQDVIDNGALKHGRDSWLEPGVFTFGARLQSVFRHTLRVAGLYKSLDPDIIKAIKIILNALGKAKLDLSNLYDIESKLSHMLHGACNFLMFHVVIIRGILKPNE